MSTPDGIPHRNLGLALDLVLDLVISTMKYTVFFFLWMVATSCTTARLVESGKNMGYPLVI